MWKRKLQNSIERSRGPINGLKIYYRYKLCIMFQICLNWMSRTTLWWGIQQELENLTLDLPQNACQERNNFPLPLFFVGRRPYLNTLWRLMLWTCAWWDTPLAKDESTTRPVNRRVRMARDGVRAWLQNIWTLLQRSSTCWPQFCWQHYSLILPTFFNFCQHYDMLPKNSKFFVKYYNNVLNMSLTRFSVNAVYQLILWCNLELVATAYEVSVITSLVVSLWNRTRTL